MSPFAAIHSELSYTPPSSHIPPPFLPQYTRHFYPTTVAARDVCVIPDSLLHTMSCPQY